MEANGRSYNHFPYNSAAPLPKKMTDDPKLGLNNAGEHSAPKYTNIAQNPSGFSHPSLINQNVFASPGHGESHFDNIGEMNSSVVAKENIGKMTDSSRPGLPEKHFAHSLQQLPDSRPQGQNISSFFHNPSQTDSEFPLSSVSTHEFGRLCSISCSDNILMLKFEFSNSFLQVKILKFLSEILSFIIIAIRTVFLEQKCSKSLNFGCKLYK